MKFKLTVEFEADRPESFVKDIMNATRDTIMQLAVKDSIKAEVSWESEERSGKGTKSKLVNGELVCTCPPSCDDCDRRFTCLDAGVPLKYQS